MSTGPDRRVLALVGEVMGLLDLDELTLGLVAALRRAVPSDYSALHELPAGLPHTISISDPAMTEDQQVAFARHAEQNPLVRHFMVRPEGRATRFSDLVTPQELHALDIYREIYGPLGVEHQVAFTLPSASGRLLGIALSRCENDFTDDEVDLLNLARPYLIQAYRNALEHTLARRAIRLDAAELRTLGLSTRQAQVLRLVAMGHSDQDAAATLGIATRTVQKHLEHVYRMLRVQNRSQAARAAWNAALT